MVSKIIMPIVLRWDASPAVAAVACAHAGLAGYLRWKDDPVVQRWIDTVFYKRVYQAENYEQFHIIRKWGDHQVLTESALDNAEVAVVFRPQIWSKQLFFNTLSFYPGSFNNDD